MKTGRAFLVASLLVGACDEERAEPSASNPRAGGEAIVPGSVSLELPETDATPAARVWIAIEGRDDPSEAATPSAQLVLDALRTCAPHAGPARAALDEPLRVTFTRRAAVLEPKLRPETLRDRRAPWIACVEQVGRGRAAPFMSEGEVLHLRIESAR